MATGTRDDARPVRHRLLRGGLLGLLYGGLAGVFITLLRDLLPERRVLAMVLAIACAVVVGFTVEAVLRVARRRRSRVRPGA